MAKPAEPFLQLISQPPSAKARRSSDRARPGRLKGDQQLPLFPNKYDVSRISINCEISSKHLFGLDSTFSVLNDMQNFAPQQLKDRLRLSNVSEAEIDELSRVYNATTKSTLSKLMLGLGMKVTNRRSE